VVAGGVRRGLDVRHAAPRAAGGAEARPARTPAGAGPDAGAAVRAGLALGVDPPRARVRDPRRAPAGVAVDALLRAQRRGADGADLVGAGRPGRAPDGAPAQRQPAGDAGRAFLLRRPAR